MLERVASTLRLSATPCVTIDFSVAKVAIAGQLIQRTFRPVLSIAAPVHWESTRAKWGSTGSSTGSSTCNSSSSQRKICSADELQLFHIQSFNIFITTTGMQRSAGALAVRSASISLCRIIYCFVFFYVGTRQGNAINLRRTRSVFFPFYHFRRSAYFFFCF